MTTLASDAPPAPDAALESAALAHQGFAWLAQHSPKQFDLLLTESPDLVQAFLDGTEGAYAEQADLSVFDPSVGLTGVLDGYTGPSEGLQAYQRMAVERGASAAAEALPAPSRWYREFHPTCDDDGDGRTDGVALDFFPPYYGPVFEPYSDPMYGYEWGRSEIRHVNASTGESDWPAIQQNGGYLPMMPPPFTERVPGRFWIDYYIAPSRHATPNPDYNLWNNVLAAPPDVLKVLPDLNGDGRCEVAAFGYMTLEWPLGINFCSLLRVCILDVYGTLRVHDGATGTPLWQIPIDYHWEDIMVGTFVTGYYAELYTMENYPTGWQVFTSPSGPKIAWKSTDMNYTWDSARGRDYGAIREHWQVFDAATGQELKSTEVTHSSGGNPRITWFNGVADLGGDDEYELVYDQKIESIGRRCGDACNPEIGALRGELVPTDATNNHLWFPIDFYTPEHQGTQDTLDYEGIPEAFAFHHASVTGDVTGDGVPDPIGTYLTVPGILKIPVNQDFKTHIAPVWGNNGSLVWGPRIGFPEGLLLDGQDIKVQGWGYVRALPNAEGVGDRLAITTADWVTPQPAGAKFPEKDNFVIVLKGEDGSSLFRWREPWATDSYIVRDLTAMYGRDGAGLVDYTGDGVPDLVTPARPVPVDSATQRLLGQVEHKYDLIDGQNGKVLQTFTAWGGVGTPLACATPEAVVMASGHGRRVDVSAFDPHTGELLWRNPYFNNPAPKGQTVGTEMLFLTGGCATNAVGGATVGINIGLYSLLRGSEVMTPLGLTEAGDEPTWLDPRLLGEAPLDPSIDFFIVQEPDLSMAQSASYAGTFSVVGVVAGTLASFLHARRWGL